MVLEELRQGVSVNFLREKYGIRGAGTISKWAKQFGKEHLLNKVIYVKMKTELDELTRLRAENKRLKISLADKQLEIDALSSLIEVAEEKYHLGLKKNFGQKV
jgi:transposase-like protein